MTNLENVNTPIEKKENSEIPSSKIDFLHDGNSNAQILIPSKELLNKNYNKKEINTLKNNIINSGTSSKNKIKKDNDLHSTDNIFILEEENSILKKKIKKKKKVKEKLYIVDNIDNIFSKFSEPKFKLIIQEYILYGIVILVCIYYWIFLFLTTTKFEQNYCYTSLDQFDSCSYEQICNKINNKLTIILYNYTHNPQVDNFENYDELLIEENRKINEYYRPFFLRYVNLLTRNKMFAKIQMNSMDDKLNFAILMSHKEKWNIFIRYFCFCHFENYYIMIIIVMAVGGGLGSIFFGILSDIYGRRTIIRVTLLICTITTMAIYTYCIILDCFYNIILKDYKDNNRIIGDDDSFSIILSDLYAQNKIREKFDKYFIFLLTIIFLLSSGLWPTLKLCLSLLVENSKSDSEVLINFRRYNLVFGGLPLLVTSLLLPNINNFTITILILSILYLLAFIYSCFFLEESIRYYYEYCEWKKLTDVVLKLYKTDLKDFKTVNEFQLKKFQKKENLKNFKNSTRKMILFMKNIKNNNDNNNTVLFRNSYYNDIVEKNIALNRNLKRNTDFIIKLDDVKSNPFLLLTSLNSNRSFKNSKIIIIIMLILLYIVLDLFQKELLEPPFYTVKEFYLDPNCNYILNSVTFIYLIINISSNYFYYALYRIDCFRTSVMLSLLFVIFLIYIYHKENVKEKDSLMNVNVYNFYMLTYYYRDTRSNLLLFIIFLIYFALNGVIFYIYLIMLKISKTIYRCTFFSIHSIAIILSMIICESIYYNMEDYYLFLSSLVLLSLIAYNFLSEFKELLHIMNDLKIDIFRQSKNKPEKEKND